MTYPSGWQAGPVAAPKSMWLGLAALVLGLLGCALPLAPFDLTGVRAYIALPFALPGFALGIIGLIGRRRGKAFAAVGLFLCMLALGLTALMVFDTVRGLGS